MGVSIVNGIRRVILIVLDSVGIGAAPDAAVYNDQGADTLGHIAESIENLQLPNMEKMGLGKIRPLKGLKPDLKAIGAYGKLSELSSGKDTTTGHWEIAGIILDKPFPTYPDGFPEEIINKFVEETGKGVLGNKAASGTAIIDELGEEHLKTGKLIVYTSADSVFQIAAHEEVIPPEELYDICRKARRILTGEHAVGRVIARPFIGVPGNFKRTERREDFSLEPVADTMLDNIKAAGYSVMGVGKISDIFAGKGLTNSNHTVGNMESVDAIISFMKQNKPGLIFANLVEFDMIYGHRRDVEGYAQALMDFDERIPEIIGAMNEDDVLMITADHGCDPTYRGTDHTREYIPLLIYGEKIKADVDLKVRKTFSDIAATITDLLNVEYSGQGSSFKEMILKID